MNNYEVNMDITALRFKKLLDCHFTIDTKYHILLVLG